MDNYYAQKAEISIMPRTIDSFSIREIRVLFDVSKEATPEKINKAYRELSKRYHPDSRGKDSVIDWDGIGPLLGEMKEILSDPKRVKAHRKAYRLGMTDRYRAQFDNYRKLFVRSLELTIHVRSYVLDPLRAALSVLHESDTAAKALLGKLKSGDTRFEDVKSFADGVGGWTGSSTKTLFFSLLCNLTDVETDEECEKVVAEFISVLCVSEKDMLSNPNPRAVENLNYFVNQYGEVSTQIMACEAERMFMEDNLKEEELLADVLMSKIKEKETRLKQKKSILQSYMLVCNTFREIASDPELKITPEILELQLKNQECLYRIECLKGPDCSDTSDDEIEHLLSMVSDLNDRIRTLQGSEAKPASGGASAAASGGASGSSRPAAGGAGGPGVAIVINALTLFGPAPLSSAGGAVPPAASGSKSLFGIRFGKS